MMIVMIKTINVNMDVAAENPGGQKAKGLLFIRSFYTLQRFRPKWQTPSLNIEHVFGHQWPADGVLILPERTVEKNRSQKRQRIGAATTWLTAPEWIFLSSLDGR